MSAWAGFENIWKGPSGVENTSSVKGPGLKMAMYGLTVQPNQGCKGDVAGSQLVHGTCQFVNEPVKRRSLQEAS